MSNTSTTLAHNIKILRKKAKISQDELAKQLKIKRSNIAAYEAKNVEPRLSVILEIARFFDIDISNLLQNKLTEDQTFSPFKSQIESIVDPNEKLNIVENPKVGLFIEKSIQMRKILTGFKAFYKYKKLNMANITEEKEKIAYDIDNFIQLMEYLMNYNENVISAITKQLPEQK